jgi:hypothetical protein
LWGYDAPKIPEEMMQQLIRLLSNFDPNQPTFPPTEIFNEGWLLRLVLDWFSNQDSAAHPLAFTAGASWFSEALLPSPFLPRFRGDPLAELRTHADGVVGQMEIGRAGKADFELDPAATQFIVLEAKIGSPLSSGTKNAPDYDQAARNVACMAEVLHRSGRNPAEFAALGFYVLAPAKKIQAGVFSRALDRSSIEDKVNARAAAYGSRYDDWLADWFEPLLATITIDALSWEVIIEWIGRQDQEAGRSLAAFLANCLEFN